MASATKIIAEIFSELRTLQTTPFARPLKSTASELPRWIDGGGRSLIINQAINQKIGDLARLLYASRPALKITISETDWSSLVQRTLGPILGAVDLRNGNTSAEAAYEALVSALDTTDWNFEKRTFLFGCSLVNEDIPAFVVGPVTITPRVDWLNGALYTGRITEITHRRLKALWSGEKLRRRKPSIDDFNERDIIDTVGNAPFICSVETDGLFGEVAKEKALTVARLTMVGVALMWVSPSKAIREINLTYDGLPYRQTYSFYQKREEIMGGSRWVNSLHGLSLFDESWTRIVEEKAIGGQ